MNICIVARTPGEAESRAMNQAVSLKRAGYEVSLILQGDPDNPSPDILHGFQVLRTAGQDPSGHPFRDADVVHAIGPDSFEVAAPAARKGKCLLVYDAGAEPHPARKGWPGMKRELRKASLIVTTNRKDSHRFHCQYPGVPIKTVALRFPFLDPLPSLALPRRFDLGPEHRLLFIPHTPHLEVGIRSLLQVLGRLPDTVHGILCGYGSGRGDADAWLREAARAGLGTRFHGVWFSCREEMIAQATGTHLACVLDTSSIPPLLHCLAARLPVLVSDRSGFHGLLSRYDCFRGVDPSDRWALKKAIESLLANRSTLRAMSCAARLAARQECWEREAETLVAAYRNHLGPPYPDSPRKRVTS